MRPQPRRELLTIDRRRGSAAAASRFRRVASIYIAHENPCANDTRSRRIDVNDVNVVAPVKKLHTAALFYDAHYRSVHITWDPMTFI